MVTASPPPIAATSLSISASVTGDEWDAFVEAHPAGTVEHLWAWRRIFEDVFGQETVYLAARRGRAIVGVLPLVKHRSLLFGRSLVSLPYANYAGLVTSEAEAARALAACAGELAQAWGATHVELRNVARHLPEVPCRTHKVGARLTLPASAEALWRGLDRKVRNQVRKAEKAALVVEHGGADLVDEFHAVFATNMRDLGTPVFPKALFERAVSALPGARVFLVRLGHRAIAGAIVIAWRDTVLVPWASSLREHRPLCANMLLYWAMLDWAATSGRRVFDFGRSSRDGGTLAFKAQWGAEEVPLHWEYVLARGVAPPDRGTTGPKARLLIEAWKRLPLPVANVLGPRVVRHVS